MGKERKTETFLVLIKIGANTVMSRDEVSGYLRCRVKEIHEMEKR